MGAEKGNTYAQKYTEKDLEEIGELLLEFASDPEEVHWADFCRKYKKPISWLATMAERRPTFKKYYQLANELMAQKYVKACLKNTWNPVFGEKYLPIYDAQYKALLREKAEMSKEQPIKEENKGAFNDWLRQQKESKV